MPICARLFGVVTILQLQGQALGLAVPSELLSALRYLATIVVLVIIAQNRQMLALTGYAPALGHSSASPASRSPSHRAANRAGSLSGEPALIFAIVASGESRWR